MGFGQTYRKKLRVKRSLAHEYVSCRQFLKDESSVGELDNDQLRTHVLNRSIECSLKNKDGFLNILNKLCDNSRVNGANIDIDITAENWATLGDVISKIKSWKRMNEGDLVEHVLTIYIDEMKKKGELP